MKRLGLLLVLSFAHLFSEASQITSRIGFWQTQRQNFAREEGRPIFGDKYSLPSPLAKVGMPGQPKPILEVVSVYLKDLEEQGYCVIPEVLSRDEAASLYERIWHEFIEKAWPKCRMEDRSNWKEVFPIHNKMGIFAGPAGQTQVMWDLRQDPRIVDVFAQVWNTDDLIVSMDGLSLMCPREIREGYCEPWPHVDQGILKRRDNVAHNNNPPIDFVSESQLKTQPYTIQGQFLFEDSFEEDGGFYCIPKSHLRFTEFASQLETISMMETNRRETRHNFLEEFFGLSHCAKHITAPRGSLILWDSRTVHWNQHPSKDRDNPKVRMVGFLCYVPKARLSDEGKALRRKAFEMGVSTGHNPSYPELKFTQDHIWPEFKPYLEDATYIQPKINLSPLGESLLGIE
jgi:Phytanoyl-CoA dioxygenase (PhyH)